ncbi:hypothetical protein GCM10010156_78180 [Planobispora rosea]|uniref:Uncharacterized protein n=1 Tax=Planobispora rosea TaxID=35762 RepID=A0A8J3S7E5_PLARO|nr:DUF5677 domain-containing protein [Planobispora rosea]GGT10121.1 hypothetical protein GCM10010156_78180 [Planobispora rosea]GIH89332.1 hypothetical protein Pro02_77400 [Planobispora rosea]
MNIESSEFMEIITNIANGIIIDKSRRREGISKSRAVLDAYSEFSFNAREIAPTWYAKGAPRAISQNRRRLAARQRTQRSVLKRFFKAFAHWEISLASSELINRSMSEIFWRRTSDPDGPERSSKLLGVADEFGGPALRLLLLTGMHARMITVSEEIILLLRNGFSDGAYGRMRTLYELVIKIFFLCNNEPQAGGFDLAERFYVAARIGVDASELDEVDENILEKARAQWGDNFFKGENNWAAPGIGIPQKSRITFRDIENAVESSHLRQLYLECNSAVHAGADQIIKAFTPRRIIYQTRGRLDSAATACVGTACTGFLLMGTMEIMKRISVDTHHWDLPLEATAFLFNINVSVEEFNQTSHKLGNIPLLP